MSDLKPVKTFRIITPKGYLSFPRLFEPEEWFKSGKKRYSCSLLVPKALEGENAERWTALNKAMLQYGVTAFGKQAIEKVNDTYKPKFNTPIKEGNLDDWDWDQEHHAIRTWSNERIKPRVAALRDGKSVPLDGDKEEDRNLVMPGAEAELLIGFYFYDTSGNQGVSFNIYGCRLTGGKAIELKPDEDLDPFNPTAPDNSEAAADLESFDDFMQL